MPATFLTALVLFIVLADLLESLARGENDSTREDWKLCINRYGGRVYHPESAKGLIPKQR